ncbi:unnamed protein product [Rhizopus stolonifer]
MSQNIRCRIPETKEDYELKVNQRMPLYNIRDIDNVHIRLFNDYGQSNTLIRVFILLQNATIFFCAYLRRQLALSFGAQNKQRHDRRIKRYRLLAYLSIAYSWGLSDYKNKKIMLSINGRERSILLQEISTPSPIPSC